MINLLPKIFAQEEYRALAEGELLAAELSEAEVGELQVWYVAERRKQVNERRRRELTGSAWSLVIDSLTHVPFWFNDDTGAFQYGRPKVIEEKERYEAALERGFSAAPMPIILHIMDFLMSYPDRMNAGLTCARWKEAERDVSFFKRVLPVETGVRESAKGGESVLGRNNFASLEAAVSVCHPGDTIVLGPGHYRESNLVLGVPVRVMSDTDEPTRCVIELLGQLRVLPGVKGVIFSSVTLSKPRKVVSVEPFIFVEGSTLSVSASFRSSFLTV